MEVSQNLRFHPKHPQSGRVMRSVIAGKWYPWEGERGTGAKEGGREEVRRPAAHLREFQAAGVQSSSSREVRGVGQATFFPVNREG